MNDARLKFTPTWSDAESVEPLTPPPAPAPEIEPNGGFPEPPPGEPVRIVRCKHECGAETEVRLPQSLPATTLRRVICSGCGEELRAFDPAELRAPTPPPPAGPAAAAAAQPTAPAPLPTAVASRPPAAPKRSRRPSARALQIASVPLIGAAVLGGLLLFGGSDHSSPSGGATGGSSLANAGPASFVHRDNFSLALPSGWKIVDPKGGAVLRAVSADGSADATLWIQSDPSLSFSEFVQRSLANLKDLAGNATIHQRLPSPTDGGTIVQLRADVPTGNGSSPYLVTLRASGSYLYYLATSVQPNASQEVRNQAALIHGSFTPEGTGNGSGVTSGATTTPGAASRGTTTPGPGAPPSTPPGSPTP